ncbi:hypothetical protein DICPUDRAFT_44131 [Dictyostelium purpureum]|uniref:C2H2-type domain-containing protein n=1 Tax=Dictyostelium purpureum TaxID=5786 RepID=F1A5I7_DICPU|nr:uncharacterized protein DICPUDRAFT_44131 [Dictyostelium purpureum]EGC28545.1 hypothetical protein DICPUDRAFT_44131 [Dictyostelium purpureum]|eukprot:XP_003294931.1 hypothetical protein DICPUDRAFT_44131 [Dictyostelium purpureum]
MGRYRGHGGTHTKNKQYKRARSTKNRAKDIDQIYNEIQPENQEKFTKFEADPDLPGMGQSYCMHCSKHFITNEDLEKHFRGKPHKNRVKELKTKPYTVEDSKIPVDNGKKLNRDENGVPTYDSGVATAVETD